MLHLRNRKVLDGQTLDLGDIRLQQRGSITVALTGMSTLPEGLAMRVCDLHGKVKASIQAKQPESGSKQLLPGKYRLLVTGRGIARQSIPFHIAAGQATRLNVDLKKKN